MSTKISNLSELSDILGTKSKFDNAIFNFASVFQMERLLRSFSELKQQGYSFLLVITKLIMIRLGGMSIYAEMKTGSKTMDENTLYRLMNDSRIDWRKMLLLFAKQFVRLVNARAESVKNALRCFVVDDTALEKTGKIIEGISSIHDHVKKSFIYGYKMLALGYYDGKMLIPADISFHRENRKNNFGLTKKEQKKQYKSKNEKGSAGEERRQELDEKKTDMVLKMVQRAVRHGFTASYVLMDSWFMCEEVIQGIRKIKKGMLHVLGVCKIDKRKFSFDGKELNSQTIININTNKGKMRNSKKYKSQYFVVDAVYKGIPVRLFYVRYKRSGNWTLILSTDLTIGFNRAMEIYQIRWTIEVLFKECKQYLRLGKSQNTNFNGQIADATLALITYTILSLGKRFGSYETIGGLFSA